MIKTLMHKPKNLRYDYFDIFDGQVIYWKFYEKGPYKENHIPEELNNKKWIPDNNKLYKIWWRHTNPSDPSDAGVQILEYIEEIDIKYIKELQADIENKLDDIFNSVDHNIKNSSHINTVRKICKVLDIDIEKIKD